MIRTAILLALFGLAASAIAQDELPVKAGQSLERGQKYHSHSRNHYLTFQTDGNLVVYTSGGQYVWGLNETNAEFSRSASIEMQTDGNLVVRDASKGFLWSALSENPDPQARLVLNSRGALQLVSPGRGVLWSSDGNLTSETQVPESNSKEPTTVARTLLPIHAGQSIDQGKRYYSSSGNHYLVFQSDSDLVVYDNAAKPVWKLRTISPRSESAASIALEPEGNLVVRGAEGGYLWSTFPNMNTPEPRTRLDLTSSGSLQLIVFPRGVVWSSDGNLTAEVDPSTECTPHYGWTHCRLIENPKIYILGTAAVSPSAMDLVKKVYTEMTNRLEPSRYSKAKLDNLVAYITNGESLSKLNKLYTIRIMHNTSEKRDELRGGANPQYLWISEQMICKKGVRTRNEAHAAGRGKSRDDAERTYDQVIHEFGHVIDARYGLGNRILQVYTGKKEPVEQFPWSIQFWFSSPAGTMSQAEEALIREIFTSKSTFSCDEYKPDTA